MSTRSAELMEPLQALSQPATSLIGVTAGAAAVLKEFGIVTVQDLASANTFAVARQVTEAADGIGAGVGEQAPLLPPDAIDQEAKDTPVEKLADEPVSVLTLIGTTLAGRIEAELGVTSVRELALWPPYREARSILSRAYGTETGPDPEAPADLVPANGRYPTERVQYEVLLFDEFVDGGAEPDVSTYPPDLTHRPKQTRRPRSLASEKWGMARGLWERISELLGGKEARPLGSDGPLDITDFLGDDRGYEVPAIGGVLTFTQSWYGQGLALGTLIHSVALGPGESTKIAMIDWTRTTSARTSETIGESESLYSSVERSRAISEITSSVARETQRGQSGASAHAESSQSGGASGGSRYGLREERSIPLGLSLSDPTNMFNDTPQSTTWGSSWGKASSDTSSSAWSTTSGEREIAAEMSQNIMDRTHQASQSVRSRRASVVREVSQKESEQISTRTITNYNHMHALTVQYYEVVQLNRTVVELSKADRCVFVPMKTIDFTDTRVVDRYRQAIVMNGLKPSVRALALAEADHIAFYSPRRTGNWDAGGISTLNERLGTTVGSPVDQVLVFPMGDFALEQIFFRAEAPFGRLIVTYADGRVEELGLTVQGEGGPLAGCLTVQSMISLKLKDIRRVTARKTDEAKDYSGSARVGCFYTGDAWYAFNWDIDVPKDLEEVILFEVQPTIGSGELIQHLNDNRLYYSQAIWRSLDPTTIGMMLSRYTWRVGGVAKPLVEIVEPLPVSMVANYLVFRISGDDETEKRAWLARKRIKVGTRNEDLIPVPSGGVFAEAVLGRFNSAEKLDITRFWNWQDSPIPITAPDIVPIQSGSRQSAEDLMPSALGAPVLNIVNPPSLPDPQGMGAVLSAIQNGNMFRDMSGLATAIGLAQAALAGAQEGAANASTQAGQNAAVAAQLNEKLTGAIIDAVASYFTGGKSAGSSGSGSSPAAMAGGISGQGGKINHAIDMDKRGVGTQTGSGTASPGASQPPSGSDDSGTSPGSGASSQGGVRGQNESDTFRAASGTDGWAGGNAMATTANDLLKTIMGAAPAATASAAWPHLQRSLVLARAKQLSTDANRIHQGALNLCGPAAFYHHIIQRAPLQFYLFAEELYEAGFGTLGGLEIVPSDDLRSADYNALKRQNPRLPAEADWMLMSALRDSENWVVDYEGDPDEWAGTHFLKLAGWYRRCGFYSAVDSTWNGNFALTLSQVKEINKYSQNHVTLVIDTELIAAGGAGMHFITLEQPLVIDEANDTITFTFWSSGEVRLATLSKTVGEFVGHCKGVITASF